MLSRQNVESVKPLSTLTYILGAVELSELLSIANKCQLELYTTCIPMVKAAKLLFVPLQRKVRKTLFENPQSFIKLLLLSLQLFSATYNQTLNSI